MKQIFGTITLLLCVITMLSSCGTYTASGAMAGSQFGHVIGSAIGGISGGWRGEHMGSLIGTVGGAVAGAAIGTAVEQAQQRKLEQADEAYQREREEGIYQRRPTESMQRRRADGINQRPPMRSEQNSPLVIRNAHIIDASHDGILRRGEECTVVFEIMNTSSNVVRDIYPLVSDVTANKHVTVSPNLRVESIAPRSGIRYTATILADRRLKDGEIVVRIGVAQGQYVIESQTQEFTIRTAKK